MNPLISKIIKNSSVQNAAIYSESELINGSEEFAPTDIPMLNVALSGKWNGGVPAGITILAGPSKMGKTFIGLIFVKAYLDKYPDSVCVFLDSEFGAGKAYFERLNIDTNRVIHIPLKNIEEAKFAITGIYNNLEHGEHVITFFDSIGNIASKKELEDAIAGKSVQDMSRAKQLKSFFRIITPFINMLNIPFIGVNHTYQTTDFFPQTVMGGGCLDGSTLLLMEDGTCKQIQNIEVGDIVQTNEGTGTVTNIYTPNELGLKPCYEIEFEDGSIVKCSENHRFWVNEKWVEAKDLLTGDDCMKLNGVMQIKSIKRIDSFPLYDITVTPDHNYVLFNGVITHNSGALYSANNVLFLSKSKDKDGKDVTGFTFKLKAEKSRFIREGATFTMNVSFDEGIDKYSDLFEFALESGAIISPSKGYYQKAEKYNDPKKYRRGDFERNDDMWVEIISDPEFISAYEQKYKMN